MKKEVVIIDYGSGNLRSAAKAFEQVAGNAYRIQVTSDYQALKQASHIVLPGVGAFGDCIAGLQARLGMVEAMREAVLEQQKPFLGICVGMQMLFEKGFENGEHKGLGWLSGHVEKINTTLKLKIPHMGWNELEINAPHDPLLKHLASGEHVYFVHSYHAVCTDPQNILATTDYGIKINAVVGKENIRGVQFHPEKSQETGLKIIGNFLQL